MVTAADIKFIKSLKERSVRIAEGIFVAEGDKLIGELASAGLVLEALYTTSESGLMLHSEPVSGSQMDRLTHFRSANSSLALFRIPRHNNITRKAGLTLVLDGVQDPGNMGTIIRLAHWYGIEQIYCSHGCADCYSPKVVQSTMGAIASVSVFYTDLQQWLVGQKDVAIYGTFLDNSQNIYTTDLRSQKDAIIVMGSEGRGISAEVEQVISRRLHIPSFAVSGEGSESLNVGVATAIVVSEFRRL